MSIRSYGDKMVDDCRIQVDSLCVANNGYFNNFRKELLTETISKKMQDLNSILSSPAEAILHAMILRNDR
jgi:hypothetical protein